MLDTLIINKVDKSLFERAHYNFIKNIPTDVFGVLDEVFLTCMMICEQRSSNCSCDRPVTFVQSSLTVLSKLILLLDFRHDSLKCSNSLTMDVLFVEELACVLMFVNDSEVSILWLSKCRPQHIAPAGISMLLSIKALNQVSCERTYIFDPCLLHTKHLA